MEARQQATRLYAALPRNLRWRLYQAVMADPQMPFRDGPDDTHVGRYFIIATGDYPAPAAQQALDQIIEQLPVTPAQREITYQVYIRHIKPLLLQVLRARRPANPFSANANAVAYRQELTQLLGAEEAIAELSNPELIGAAAMNRRKHFLNLRMNPPPNNSKGGRRKRKTRRSRKN